MKKKDKIQLCLAGILLGTASGSGSMTAGHAPSSSTINPADLGGILIVSTVRVSIKDNTAPFGVSAKMVRTLK